MTDTEHDKLHARFKELHQELSGDVLPIGFVHECRDMLYDCHNDGIVSTEMVTCRKGDGGTEEWPRPYFDHDLAEYLLLAVQIAEDEVGKS